MNFDSLSLALSQISYLVANLTKKNYKQSSIEISNLVDRHYSEAEQHLFRCLFSWIDFSGDGKSSGKDNYQIQLLTQEFNSLISRPSFFTAVINAVENPLSHQKTLYPSATLIPDVSRVLHFTKLKEVILAIALQHSTNPELRKQASKFLSTKVPELVRYRIESFFCVLQELGIEDTSVEVLHLLLAHISESEAVSNEEKENFFTVTRKEFSEEQCPVILLPLLYCKEEDYHMERLLSDTSTDIGQRATSKPSYLAETLHDLGCASCSSKEQCLKTLEMLKVFNLPASQVARVVNMMAQSASDLIENITPIQSLSGGSYWSDQKDKSEEVSSSWNVDAFLQVAKEKTSSLNARDVCSEFDFPGFLVKDTPGFHLLTRAIIILLNGNSQEKFPISVFYRTWKNTHGQLSWIQHALAKPSILCLADYITRPTNVEMLKQPIDEENKEVMTWKSLDLVEALFSLSDYGHHDEIKSIFQNPAKLCPDLLTLSILQSGNTWPPLRQEMLLIMIPIFLGSHPNSAMVLNFVWNGQGQSPMSKQMLMHCMAEWYMRNEQYDQQKLSRILDVAQDLKALSMLLNHKPFTFVIDLAALASRREYLKLDKWLSDKIKEHKEEFIEACISFLKRRCPAIAGGPQYKEDHSSTSNLPPETLTTMLACLQSFVGNVSQDLSESILTMVATSSNLLNKSRHPPPGVMVKPRPQTTPQPPSSLPPPASTAPNIKVISICNTCSFSTSIGQRLGSQLGGSTSNSLGLSVAQPSVTSSFSSSQFGLGGGSQSQFMQGGGIGLGSSLNSGIGSGLDVFGSKKPAVGGLGSAAQQAFQQAAAKTTKQPMSDQSQVWPEMNQQFNKEIEDEANGYFQRIYNQPPHPTLSVDDILDLLQNFKDSNNKKEREVFNCMMRNLFEEYRFFPQQYPDKELHITACLFGGIIEKNLVTYMALGIALRYVLEALRKPHNSKMYYFGIAALDRFKGKLKDYPQYCCHISAIAHFNDFPNHLVEYVEYGKRSEEPPVKVQCSVTTPGSIAFAAQQQTTGEGLSDATMSQSTTVTSQTITAPTRINLPVSIGKDMQPSIAKATNIDTLLGAQVPEEKIPEPPESLQDKIAFIFNNLSVSNMGPKIGYIQELLDFGYLYKNILVRDAIALTSTRENVQALCIYLTLNDHQADQTLIIHLFNILDIEHKSIILPCIPPYLLTHHFLYRPKHTALYNMQVFIYPMSLQLNLKFEVEVLCKNLNIDINDIKAVNYLRDPEIKFTIDCQVVILNKLILQPLLPIQLSTSKKEPGTSSKPSTPSEQPQSEFKDINVYSIATLQSHLTIKMELPLLQAQPQLKACVRPAVERGVQDLLQPIVERAIKIALTTCEQIVRKDFALDPEEFRMRTAAHHMVRNLTAGMALITCREQLLQSIANHLKQNFGQALTRHPQSVPPQQKEMIEQTANMIAADNVELACCFIQKTAVEKAIMDMDKRMATEFELRKHARQEGRRYCDPGVLTYQAERMPEQIRLKVGGVTPQQTAVYEEFARCVPGFLPSNDSSQPSGFLAKPMQAWGAVDDITQVYDRCIAELEQHLQLFGVSPTSVQFSQLQTLHEAIMLARNSREIVTALALLQKAVEGLLDASTHTTTDQETLARYRECHVLVLKALQDQRAYGPQWTNKQVTQCLINHRDEYKYNVEAVELLIRAHLVNMQQYDQHLAQSMENGLNYMAVVFAMQLVKLFLVDEKQNSLVVESDIYNTVDVLNKINTISRGAAPEGLSQLMEMVRSNYDSILDKVPGGPTHMMHSGISQAREYDDPPGLHEKTEYLLREWVNIYHSPTSGRDSTRGFSAFVQQMHHQGILRTDDLITRFFRLCTEMCVDLTYRLLQESNVSPSLLNPTLVRAKCFHTLDAFVRLITLLVKHSGDAVNSVTKINLLNKVLGIVVGVLLQDHDTRQTEYHQMPYHRIFIMLFYELNAPEHVLESINFQTLTAFTNTYHILRPSKAPGFAFAWLEVISYRSFISRMLLHTPQQKGWPMYAQLLIDLFKFLAPFLRNVELTKSIQILYRGTLRLLLVLLHDFPEFLCDYHYGFCDVIPANCIQLRNLILSAFPRNMRLPDPFTPNLKVDMLQEINVAPRILTNFIAVMPAQFQKDLDSYLKTRAPVTFLSDLRTNLQISNERGIKYNVPLINSLVLHVGTQAIAYIHNKGGSPSMATITHSSHMDIFQNLAVDLDTEGRYLFLNAIANQLRYPNSHTHYFSCTLLYLFAETNQESIQEQITRVLLERLIVNRPHPWGLLITFIELIKNPNFKFWNHEFVHCAPEISKLFESVARSCMGKQFTQQGVTDTATT
uniref:CCR4-NOT transcription complex subunit 1 n=1 Tax=Ciona intestinalis TaxID=7719 RepID=F7BBD1_CIOIN